MKNNFHVICPDIVGRGHSDWLHEATLYNYTQYISDMTCLFSRLDVSSSATQIDWIGTSMGGILGMLIAAQPNTPIRRLIMNDIGPSAPTQALMRIKKYIEQYPSFHSFSEAKMFIKRGLSSFGKLSESQWDHLTNTSIRKENDIFKMAYDPALITAYVQAVEHQHTTQDTLWDIWKTIQCPILLLHGLESDILTSETLAQMKSLKPEMEIVEFNNLGHAPSLMESAQTDIVKNWLLN